MRQPVGDFHPFSHPLAARDRAALHDLGALPPEEAARFRAHLGTCFTCRIEVESLGKVTSRLGLLPIEAEPPAGLRARLLERAGLKIAAVGEQPPASPEVEQIWKQWEGDPSAAAEIVVRAADGTWEPTGCPGVEVRRLFADPANEGATLLIRMAPGSSYPAHRHGRKVLAIGTRAPEILSHASAMGSDLNLIPAGPFPSGVRSTSGAPTPRQAKSSRLPV